MDAKSCAKVAQKWHESAPKMSVSCASGRSVGEMEMTVVSNDRVTGKMALVMRTEAGAQKLNATLESRWLGADCGKLKPGERRPISSR